MIKINLLSSRQKRKDPFYEQRVLQGQVGIGIGILLLIIGACWVLERTLTQQHNTSLREKQSKEQMLATLNDEAKQLRQLEQTRTVLLTDYHLLESPDSQKRIPVVLMDVVSRSLDSLNLWLFNLSINELEVELEGRALDGKDILQFVENLERSAVFGNLTTVETRIEHGQSAAVHHFNLSFRMKG